MFSISCQMFDFNRQDEARPQKGPTTERTFIVVKPDGVQRNLASQILSRFEVRGFKLVAIKMVHASKEHLQVHYRDHEDKFFFNGLIEYMTSGPIVCAVFQGPNVVQQSRKILGIDHRSKDTIRGDMCIPGGNDVCGGSDSVESANREIKHWFKDDELFGANVAAQS
ncbi:Nucleoside diphosphate kinase [Aphelenchoides fujianensis]|nr:Nucleoside diphosphate kinase [Aphelenchoides fujianensis]